MLTRARYGLPLATVLIEVAQCAVGAFEPLGWQTVLPQYENRDYLSTRPRTRYSHTATVVGDELVLAFGYFNDRVDGGGPTWLSDVWAWRQPKPAEPDDDAEPASWSQVWSAASAVGPGPQPRTNHAAVALTASTLVIFGGKGKSEDSLNDAWQLDVGSGTWKQLGDGIAVKPSPRSCFSAALLLDPATFEPTLVIYGGFHLGDTWAFSFTHESWRLLVDEPDGETVHPGIRAAHSAVADEGGSAMFVYGGMRFQEDVDIGSRQAYGKLDDLWQYSLRMNEWREMPQAQLLGGRIFFGMFLLPGDNQGGAVLGVHGGSHCNPKCSLDASLLVAPLEVAARNSTAKVSWSKLEVDPEPRGRYHHTVTYHHGALWLLGGESYEPIIYYNSVLRLPLDTKHLSQGIASRSEL